MTMPEQSPAQPSAAAINAEIRALWVDGALPAERRGEYARLVVAWAEAMRAEQELAA
ncbi:hypothetical protein [Streptomyces sp. adm13(2018)]|uniref:hypothetical protein n=1 Tax=Streptomyces sp. adm13(2018) TaxID=2479007 RepID=UPI00165073D2|nr:hypothetical protein [Streptomyces sp. adm13(2018)]